MPWLAPVIGGAAALAGGVVGASSASGDREAATRAYQQSVEDLTAIGVPSIEAQKIIMQQYQSAGKWTPELEETVQRGQSEMGNISTDPNYKAAQMQALSQLQDIGNRGGVNLTDQANLESTMGNIQATEKGSRDAILQHAAQQGGYGSGTSLAAQLSNQQNASQLEHQAGLQSAASAQQRALQAIQSAGQLGTGLQQQEFAQKSQQAQAQDAINAWNAQNKQNVYGQNTGVGNQASQYNLSNQQNLMNANTDVGNKQNVYNQGLQQQQFQNQMSQAQAKANARAGQATNSTANANANANMWSGIGSSVAQGVVGASQLQNANDQKEKDRNAYGY